jgi:effector-binding domain-containing protein
MPKLTIERSVVIGSPVADVYALVSDFHRWPEWSPWLIADDAARLSFADDGKSYTWESDIVGGGTISLLDAKPNESLSMSLLLLTPWESESDVHFSFEAVDAGTRVTWRMDGSLPIFLFFLKPIMQSVIGMDYDRGLGMLKDLAELGSVPSQLEFLPEQSHPGGHYIGIVRNCELAEMPELMKVDYERLHAHFQAQGLQVSDCPFTIYSKWKLSKGKVQYTVCFPVAEKPVGLSSEFATGHLPELKAYVVQHTGAYRHLGNAWSAGIMRGRKKLFMQSKRIFPFEQYVTELDTVPDSEIVTKVYFPIA